MGIVDIEAGSERSMNRGSSRLDQSSINLDNGNDANEASLRGQLTVLDALLQLLDIVVEGRRRTQVTKDHSTSQRDSRPRRIVLRLSCLSSNGSDLEYRR